MFEQTFKNIDDILHKDAGCGSELDYIEQTSWILFLKYLDDLEKDRATAAEATIFTLLNDKQKEFISFVLNKYIETGVDELDQEKLPILLQNKYQSLQDAREILGEIPEIRSLFIEFQEHLYNQKTA